MSGRKSTEVNGLLARGKDARNAGNANYLKNISTAEKSLRSNQKKISEINSRIAGQHLEISKVCLSEFPKEAEQLKNQFDSLCKANKPVDYKKTLDAFQKKQQRLEQELQRADDEAEQIRERIRNKNWYCDEEYRDANKLLKTYKQIAAEKNSLVTEMNQRAQLSNQELIQYQNLEKQVSQVCSAYRQLEDRANQLAELHKRASEARDYIHKAIRKIDRQLAEKFLGNEYKELKQKCEAFESLSEEAITKRVTEMSEQIGLFENQLHICYEKFLENKEKAEEAIRGNRRLLNTESNFFYDPVDYAKNGESAKKIELLEYLADYSEKQEMINKIQSGLRQAEEYLQAERFAEAEKQAQQNQELIRQAVEYASMLQEHLIENFYVAKDIRGVMRQMGFETGAFKIDGNVKNGWKISAKNPGGDLIDFTQVFIDDNGEVKVEIDHQTQGNCPSKWSDICKALDDVGIYIEKIDMVNGGNVLNRREKKKDSGYQETETFQTQPSHG